MEFASTSMETRAAPEVEGPDIAVSYDLRTVTVRELLYLLALGRYPKWHHPVLGLVLGLTSLVIGAGFLGFIVGLPAAVQIGEWTLPKSFVACLVAFAFLRAFMSVARTRALLKLSGTLTVEVRREGLWRRETARATLDLWHGIVAIEERENEILFRYRCGMIFWLPRRAFPSPEALEGFLAMARKRRAAAKPPEPLPELA
jgi:hypothetical protein